MEAETKEEIILLHLLDWTNVAIADKLKVRYYVVESTVNKFKRQTQLAPLYTEQLAAIKRAECRLIELAERGNKMSWSEQKEYEVLRSCYASADINNFSAFVPG
jgi:hypothetical protein